MVPLAPVLAGQLHSVPRSPVGAVHSPHSAASVVVPRAPVLAGQLHPVPGSPVGVVHSPHFAGPAFRFIPARLPVQSVRNRHLGIPVLALLVGVHWPRARQLQSPLCFRLWLRLILPVSVSVVVPVRLGSSVASFQSIAMYTLVLTSFDVSNQVVGISLLCHNAKRSRKAFTNLAGLSRLT